MNKLKSFKIRADFLWIVYAVLWLVVMVYPIFSGLVIASKGGDDFSWAEVFSSWLNILPFFILFLVHRIPVHYLFFRNRIRIYILSASILLCGFGVCRYYTTPINKIPQRPLQEHLLPPPVSAVHPSLAGDELADKEIRKNEDEHHPKAEVPHNFRNAHRPTPRPGTLPKPLLLDVIIACLMLGFDLAIALLVHYQEGQVKARRLEAIHLRHELDNLKAQINPHFFMNMLNNIHGMVELDPAKAQVMIMELSKLMRYVLYEGTKSQIPLYKEINFISDYVELMRKRYSSQKVRISLELPQRATENLTIPPLLFISIVENAFKHGISYQTPSFVEIKMEVENNRFCLYCTNSIHRRQPTDGSGGVGLINLRQRLQLLFNDSFSLDITDVDNLVYQVKLTIPCNYEADSLHSN